MKIKNLLYIFSILFLTLCKDPIYNQCDGLCNINNQCVKLQINTLKELQNMNDRKWEQFFYTNCMDACMIYNQEIFECFRENQIHLDDSKFLKDTTICSKIVDCVLPIFLNQ